MSIENTEATDNSSTSHQQQQQYQIMQNDDDIEQQRIPPPSQESSRDRQPYIFVINESSQLLPQHPTTQKNYDIRKNNGDSSSSSHCSSGAACTKMKRWLYADNQEYSFWSFAINFWNWYDRQLHESPVLTKSLTAGIIVSMGDFCGQYIEQSLQDDHYSGLVNPHTYDIARLGRFFLVGGMLQAPVTHYYFEYLDAKFPPTPNNPWTPYTFLKLAIDQLLFAPTFTLVLFFFVDTLRGDPLEYQVHHAEDKYMTTMIAQWKLWIPAILINFAFCPPKLRVLYNNAVFFVWSIFLSLLLNHE
mmetsp:Transcript_30710/g.35006  ORF Transcript_30710/g.35006 Transcript_30710/m.35006 type:complete len:302 (-) Transcript_30710:193-1098(-)